MNTPRRPIPLTFIDAHSADGVATLRLNRPQAGNALNWAMLEQLRSAFGQAVESPDVEAIVIAAAGNRFVSGADVGFFVRCLDAGEMSKIVDCIRVSQEVFAQIAACHKPVVAAVSGAALGGGVELALACHHILATPRASFSFPETALGIVPASGGTYRTPRRIGVELTKWLVSTGHVLSPPKALALGLIDALVMPDQLTAAANSAARTLAVQPAAAPQQPTAPPAEFAVWRSLFAGWSVSQLRAAAPTDDRTVDAVRKALAGRPLAGLAWSETLIDAALGSTLEQGATAALAAVPVLFGDPDVRALLAAAAAVQRRASANPGK